MSTTMDEVTEQTLSDVIKATETTGWTTGLGAQGVDLGGLVNLQPTTAKFRNSLPRVQAKEGSEIATWRALLNNWGSQPDGAIALDYAAAVSEFKLQNMQTPYRGIGMGGIVTQDAQDIARAWEDVYAGSVLGTMNQAYRTEDINLLMAWACALPTIAAPTLATHTTGGTILHTQTLDVQVQARSGKNFYYGGSGIASSKVQATIAGSGDTQSVTASVAAVQGAVAYDWFGGLHSGTMYYITTTTVNTLLITAVPGANNTTVPSLPEISTTLPTAPAVADTSYNAATNMNGLMASFLADWNPDTGLYVTPGTGLATGAYYTSLNGAGFTASGSQGIVEIDALNLFLWNAMNISPSRYLVNAQESGNIATKVIGSGGGTMFLQPGDNAGRLNITAGNKVGTYLNRAVPDDAIIPIETHSHVPPGTFLAVVDQINFEGEGVKNVFEARTQRDYSLFDYGANRKDGAGGGPRRDYEVKSFEAFVNRAPMCCAAIGNIGNS